MKAAFEFKRKRKRQSIVSFVWGFLYTLLQAKTNPTNYSNFRNNFEAKMSDKNLL